MRLTCKEASHLISGELDGRLGLGQRIALRLHLLACGACSRVKAQMGFLRRAMAAYVNDGDGSPDRDRDNGNTPPKK